MKRMDTIYSRILSIFDEHPCHHNAYIPIAPAVRSELKGPIIKSLRMSAFSSQVLLTATRENRSIRPILDILRDLKHIYSKIPIAIKMPVLLLYPN